MTPASARKVIKLTTQVLDMDGTSKNGTLFKELTPAEKAKALYRRAQARSFVGEIAEALADLEQATKLVPSDGSILKEKAKVVKQIQAAKAKQRSQMAKLFA